MIRFDHRFNRLNRFFGNRLRALVGTELKPYTSFTWILNYRSSVAQQSVVSLGGVPPGAHRSLAVTLPTCWVGHWSPRILPCRFSSIFSSQQIRSMVLKKGPRRKPGSLTADLIELTMKRSSRPFYECVVSSMWEGLSLSLSLYLSLPSSSSSSPQVARYVCHVPCGQGCQVHMRHCLHDN